MRNPTVVFFFLLINMQLISQTCINCNGSQTINASLKACYQFNGSANDGTLFGNNGNVSGALLTSNRLNYSNSAYYFPNVNSKVSIPFNSSLDISGNGNVSFAVWVYPTMRNALDERVINFGSISGRAYEIDIVGYASGADSAKVQFLNYSATSTPNFVINIYSTNRIALNAWSLIVLTVNANLGISSLYINGSYEAGSSNVPVIPTSPTASLTNIMTIGNHYTAAWGFLGKIDDVRVYNRILSVSEISGLLSSYDLSNANAGKDMSVCKNDTVQLSGSGGEKYKWSPGGSLSNDTIANPLAFPNTTTDYILTVTTGICSYSDTVRVTISNCEPCLNCTVSEPRNTGLSLCLPLDNSVNDYSTNGNNGVSTGVAFSTNRIGKAVSSAFFNGTTSKIQLVTSTLLVNSYSYCGWVKFNVLPSNGAAMSVLSIGGTTQDQAILVYNNLSGNNGWGISSYGSNGTSYAASSNIMPVINKWYFVCQTRNNNSVKLYVNGILIVNKSIPNISAGYAGGTVEAMIGCRTNPTLRQYFYGYIDDIRIYNRVITPYEVISLNGSNDFVNVNAGNDKSICFKESIQLNATGASKYKWHPSSGLNNDTIANPIAFPDSTTTYIVVGSGGNCNSSDTIKITVNPKPSVIASNDTTVCPNSSLVLSAVSSDSNFLWSNGDTTKSITVLPTFSTTYWVSSINGYGCTDIDSINVYVIPIPQVVLTNDTDICEGSSITLSCISNAGSLLWSTGATTTSITVKPTITTTYRVKYTNLSGCVTTDSVTVKVVAIPIANLDPDTSICEGQGITLLCQHNGNAVLWSTGAISNSITVKPIGKTVYWVKVTNLAGCSTFDSITVEINKAPLINAGNDTTICNGTLITLKCVGDYTKLLWNNGATTDSINVMPTSSTVYWVTATSALGCDKIDSIKINVISTPNKPVIIRSQNILISNYTAGNQWYVNNIFINGANAQSYTPLIDGKYSVDVTLNGCTSLKSDSFNFIKLGMRSFEPNQLLIYPNPSKGIFKIKTEYVTTGLQLFDIHGKELETLNKLLFSEEINLSTYENGTYLLKINYENGCSFIPLLIVK